MKPRPLFLLLTLVVGLLLALNLLAYAAADRIELNDGSVILGEIVSYSGGVYTIRSDTLGTITLKKNIIRDIRMESSETSWDQPTSPGNTSIQETAKALQETMAGNPDIKKSIDSLQDDPDFQQVMKDPELMKAINSGNISELLANPKFMKLLDKPAVQEITEKMAP